MDKNEAIKKAREYAALVSQTVSPRKIILYGSYAKETWTESSDINIAVVVDAVESDFLELETKLYKLRRNVDDRIEPVLLEESSDKSGFLESIKKYGYTIYSAS